MESRDNSVTRVRTLAMPSRDGIFFIQFCSDSSNIDESALGLGSQPRHREAGLQHSHSEEDTPMVCCTARFMRRRHLSDGRPMRIPTIVTVAIAIAPLVLQAQVPSQRNLNGFLLGQHKDAIAASFSEVLRVDTTPDRWVYRTYLLDRPHGAYMSFKFAPDRPDYAISVQLAGASGTTMRPFGGL